MKITWFAHASFLIEGDGLSIITDPYHPEELSLPPVAEPADIVIRSSDDDLAHAFVDSLPSGFELITATEIVDDGVVARGIEFQAVWSQESLEHKNKPKDNAMYSFVLDGIRVCHMGDIGNKLDPLHLEFLRGVDILLALAGGPPTIELQDLFTAITILQPKLVIPMHYRIPGPKFFMLPVDDFLSYFPDQDVERLDSASINISAGDLTAKSSIKVLQPLIQPG